MKKPTELKSENQRRYPRVFLDKSLGDFKELLGVQVRWPHDDVGGVLDISYIGAALSRPAGIKISLTPNEMIPLEFLFGNHSVKINAYFVREMGHVLGVHFPELSVKAHVEIENFLKDKIVGLHTRYIEPRFYSANQDFSHWYHGPNDTNIFIWEDHEKISKATVELGQKILFYENESFHTAKITQWMEDPNDDYAYYIRYIDEKESVAGQTTFFEKIVSVLTQIQDNRNPIERLLNVLKNYE